MTYTLPDPRDLEPGTLVMFARGMQHILFLPDYDDEEIVVDPDKEWDADSWDRIQELMRSCGLWPEEMIERS